MDKTEDSIRPRYMETVEESLNDTAHILSASIEENLPDEKPTTSILKKIASSILSPIFKNAKARNFEAKIYSLTKTETDIQAYVTDHNGLVIFDSEGYREGLDYSKFNDVLLTLKGKYGARSSKLQDASGEGALFVAAPISWNQQVIGVITVVKPKISVVPFIELAKEKFWRITLVVGFSIAFVFSILAYLMFRPIGKLSVYVAALRNKSRIPFPKIGLKELELLGKEIDSLVSALEGKEYIENYVQTLTHEIKSPLSSIIASSELLETHPENSKILLENISKEGKRIQRIIEQMLSLSSLEGKKYLLKREEVDLNEVLKEVISSFDLEFQTKGIKYQLAGPKAVILADREYLGIAFQNLIRNSMDFANFGDRIQINISKLDDSIVKVDVLDEGSTIPEYALSRIQERFYSLPRPHTHQKSSGLGLSIVKQIAELHHAELLVQNREGNGVQASLIFRS
nr:two-component system sensor histidine kinase CreC [Leptospira ognonensis]